MTRALVLALMLAGPARGDEPEAPVALRFDPFAQPDPERLAARSRNDAGTAATWSPVLRATLATEGAAQVDLGGEILAVGEESHGYRLIEVREGEAVFERAGTRLVLRVAPGGARE